MLYVGTLHKSDSAGLIRDAYLIPGSFLAGKYLWSLQDTVLSGKNFRNFASI